ncbi:MAG: hypothetical protein KH202_06625 [Clostridiales bacterium]|nr:hypothetical protein [Clostridiales bacterium]
MKNEWYSDGCSFPLRPGRVLVYNEVALPVPKDFAGGRKAFREEEKETLL